MESCSGINDGNGRLVQGEDEVRRIWGEYLYNIDNQEQVAVNMCGFDGVRKGNYLSTSQESHLEELMLRCDCGNSRMKRPQVKDEITG